MNTTICSNYAAAGKLAGGLLAALLISSAAVAQGPSKSSKRFEGQTMHGTQSTQPAAPAPRPASNRQPAAQPATSYPAPAQRQPAAHSRASAASGTYWDRFKLGVTARVSTLGFGVELSAPIIQDKLNLRLGFNSFNYDYEEDEEDGGGSDLEYEGDLELRSIPLLVDYHPFSGGFRATAGVIFNGNEINAVARCGQPTCEFGDQQFDRDTIGESRLDADLGGTHPYLGIGWGNAVDSVGRWSFAFDLGVVFHDVSIDITPSQACLDDARCAAEVENEEAELRDDVEDFDLYPVLSFGISYKLK